MRKWTLLFLLFHITTCQIDQDNQSDLLHAESSKIIPELLPQDSISIKISKDIEQQTDSILKLAFYPVQIDSLVFDTLIVYSKKGSENTLSNSILVLGYFNKSFDSSYYDLQMGPYLLLSITQDEYTVSSLYYELSQLAVPSILSESQMCKMIQKKYPELKI